MESVGSEDESKGESSYHGNANAVNLFHHSLERCVLSYKETEVCERGKRTSPKGKINRRAKLDDAVR
jgi:hypothetical protein